MKIDISIINNNKVLHYLETPKSGDFLGPENFSIRGWAYANTGAELRVAIRHKGKIFFYEKDGFRPDVERYLHSKGFIKNIKSHHGFNFQLSIQEDFQIGFELCGEIIWAYEASKCSPPNVKKFTEFKDLKSLLQSEEGVCENVYFHNASDWSKIVILFNGALTPAKVKAEKAIFQRWSWARHFKHPVLSIADPLTIADDPIVLGWYLGSSDTNALPHILNPIIYAVREINPQARLVGIGSSGGGFAAIGATLTGHLDEAIAINPQTDAILFEHRQSVERFLAKRNGAPCDSDLKKYDLSKINRNGRITYLQNLYDRHHFDVHYSPFKNFCQQGEYANHFNFIEYADEKSGHNPPNLKELSAILGNNFSILLN